MSVQVDIPQFLQHLCRGLTAACVTGSTVGECLHAFVEQLPGTRELLFDREGRLLPYLDVYVNDRSTYPGELTEQAKDGDRIGIMYLISGG